jgi:hypothetical protein
MKDESVGGAYEDTIRVRPVFTCQICGKRDTHWVDLRKGLAPGREKWVPSCERCQDVLINTGNRRLNRTYFN